VTQIHWWIALLFVSVGIMGLDIVSGPYILFPIAFVVPVGLAAWYLGSGAGIVFAVALVGCRLGISTTLEDLIPIWAAAVNAGIRLLVLVGLALLLPAAKQKRALAKRVQLLEGILPICAFCKKIRRPDGVWEQIETYVSERSAAQFSHGFCEVCGRKHYPELFPGADAQDAEPGVAADSGRDAGS
jgi:hypothetical protein